MVNTDSVSVSVIRPGVTRIQTISVPTQPLQVAVGESGVWVADWKEGAVTRIDPDTRRVVDKIRRSGIVWLPRRRRSRRGSGSESSVPSQIVRIDPTTNRVTAHIQ